MLPSFSSIVSVCEYKQLFFFEYMCIMRHFLSASKGNIMVFLLLMLLLLICVVSLTLCASHFIPSVLFFCFSLARLCIFLAKMFFFSSSIACLRLRFILNLFIVSQTLTACRAFLLTNVQFETSRQYSGTA